MPGFLLLLPRFTKQLDSLTLDREAEEFLTLDVIPVIQPNLKKVNSANEQTEFLFDQPPSIIVFHQHETLLTVFESSVKSKSASMQMSVPTIAKKFEWRIIISRSNFTLW